MKENKIIKDIYNENFTTRDWIVYGILAPIAITLGCLFAEVLNNL